MPITYNNTTIDFFDSRKVPEQIILSLSGGLDSAALFYLLCKHFPSMKIIPYTCRDKAGPFDAFCARDIVQWMKERFPNQNISPIEEIEFDHTDPYWIQMAKDKWEDMMVYNNGKKVSRTNKVTGLSKVLQKTAIENSLQDKYPNTLICTGMTCNPPVKEQKMNGFYHLAERKRDPIPSHPENTPTRYHPFNTVSKKFVADIYKKHDLMDSLYPLTYSCVGSAKETNYFIKTCGKCFWCYEKKWAFGDYDVKAGRW